MTLPRSRRVQALILLTTCGAMAAFPLANHFRNAETNRDTAWFAVELSGRHAAGDASQVGRNKDYPLWYATGRAFMAGQEYYPSDAGTVFPFMYPPFAALLLGLVSGLGPDGMLIVFVLLNVLSVAVAVELSVRLAAGTADVSLWLRLIPGAICLFFVNDMFLLGQPNLGLLCLVLGGLMLARSGWEVGGGGLLAAAAALKAFPAVVIVYLVWRRHWTAAAAMVAFTALFLVPLPAAVRGWDRSVAELQRWANGMLFKQGESGFGQRPEQSLGWKNQSLFGVGHRLLRPVNAYADELNAPPEAYAEVLTADPTLVAVAALPPATGCDVARGVWAAVPTVAIIVLTPPPRELFVNLLTLTHQQALAGIVLVAGLLGLGFVGVIPARAARTRASDALEFGILTVLVTICTPYAYAYYFVWMLFPLTVLVQRGLSGPTAFDRRLAWGAVAAVTALFALSAPLAETREMMAYGVQFWAALVAAVGCGWALVRERTSRRRSC